MACKGEAALLLSQCRGHGTLRDACAIRKSGGRGERLGSEEARKQASKHVRRRVEAKATPIARKDRGKHRFDRSDFVLSDRRAGQINKTMKGIKKPQVLLVLVVGRKI